MNQKGQSELNDEELIQQAKKKKSIAITNAVLIGFLIGIVIYGIVKNNFGFFALIPLFLAYKLINKSKNEKE